MGRVNGLLAVSRGLGDFMFKSTPELPPASQPVSPVPDILGACGTSLSTRVGARGGESGQALTHVRGVRWVRRSDVARSPHDAYIVLACDGVWDVMSNEQVKAAIVAYVARGVTDMGAVSAHIVNKALELGSHDNISCAVVRLPGAPMPPRYDHHVRSRTHARVRAA